MNVVVNSEIFRPCFSLALCGFMYIALFGTIFVCEYLVATITHSIADFWLNSSSLHVLVWISYVYSYTMGICPAKVDKECPENYTNTERKQSVVSNGMVIRYFQWLVPYTSWICFTIIMASPLIISFWDFCAWWDTPLKPCILSWPCIYTNYRHLTALCYVLSHFRHVIPATFICCSYHMLNWL